MIFQERNIPFIDINDEPEFSENSQTLFFDVVHPNELGHKIIAKIINDKLSNGAHNIAMSYSTPSAALADADAMLTPQCTLSFDGGWHAWERNGSDWWRWTDGHGEIRVVNSEDGEMLMHGEIYSIRRPNTVDVLVNGEKQATWQISWDLFKAFEPVVLRLRQGENRIIIVSHNPAMTIPTDGRPLALAVSNLRAASANGAAVCELQL